MFMSGAGNQYIRNHGWEKHSCMLKHGACVELFLEHLQRCSVCVILHGKFGKLDEENPTYAGLAHQNDFGSA
jgi:hypothetical protein